MHGLQVDAYPEEPWVLTVLNNYCVLSHDAHVGGPWMTTMLRLYCILHQYHRIASVSAPCRPPGAKSLQFDRVELQPCCTTGSAEP